MIIIEDSSEKIPWNFTIYSSCAGQERGNVETGDYTIKGLESQVALERKASTAELCLNLGVKYKNFLAEFERMQHYRFRYLVCEFPIENIYEFPKNSGIPPYKWKYLRMNGKFILSRITSLCETYGVEYYFCDNRSAAEAKAIQLLEQVYEIYQQESK